MDTAAKAVARIPPRATPHEYQKIESYGRLFVEIVAFP
jgi:hypothetical protein